jgi:ferredoxin--NADP+ reductase
VLDVSGTPLAGSFLPGQSFGVIAPGTDSRGKPHKVRLYSIASPSWGEDGSACLLSTTPKRLIDEHRPQRPDDDATDHRLFLGVCSNYLCDLTAGDPVSVSGPNGRRFVLPRDPSAHDYLFLATGTGIAPFRGMILELLERACGPCRSRIDLVMGTPYTTDLLYDDVFRGLAAQHGNFRYHTAISREAGGEAGKGRYVADCVRDEIGYFAPLLADSRTLLYMCGLVGMQFEVFRILAELGLENGYMAVPRPLRDEPPTEWSNEMMSRYIKPTSRCMLELY